MAKWNNISFNVGDTISVQQKIIEGDKERSQTFVGVVIAIKGRGVEKTFTVRKIAADNIGVERIWPFTSPWIKKISLKKKGKVRRAKLYYLRKRRGKAALKVKSVKKASQTKQKDKSSG